jgi:FkbM family methyltransferase
MSDKKYFYEKCDYFNEPHINLKYEDVLKMTLTEFEEWVAMFRKTVVDEWNKTGAPPRIGSSEAEIIDQFSKLQTYKVEKFEEKDDEGNDVIFNFNKFATPVNQFFPAMYKTGIGGSSYDKPKPSIYDIFCNDEYLPEFAKQIQQSYPEFNVINTAVSNTNGHIHFNKVINSSGNLGMSSIRLPSESMKTKNAKHFHIAPEQYIETTAKCIRMDTWIEENNINNIDILKIDVEGCTYECLEGFGNKLDIVKIMHIEAEHVQCWEGQRLYADVAHLLEKHNFKLVDIIVGGPSWEPQQQSDSVWINTKFLH